ncbi:alpha/beta hydrolase [Lactiplantibacillus paraplantarum]|uniref:alpha/beta hydrolase n=2 Tax=Lactiplantibacillus paraplantarum TaxID=60520 RepID=UPI00053511A6|nr:alpha/beta fold hydrolase [Lactiplantibacillus paraplantarum]
MMTEDYLKIKAQGVFAAGGIVQTASGTFDPIKGQMADDGQIRHSYHASIFYQIPADGNGKAITFLAGYGQSKNGWMSTPDGRDGFSNLFLKKGYGVYLADQPRRGAAGQSSVPVEISAKPDDLNWFTQFRMGLWPKFMSNSQFPQDEQSIDQFFRQMTPDTGKIDFQVITQALVASLEKSGPSVLMTHSQGGVPGWMIGAASDNVTGIIAIEPGSFFFPENEVPAKIDTKYPMPVQGVGVPMATFNKLIQKPIVVYYGDNIPDEPSEVPAWDFWRGVKQQAHQFADVVNAHGGDATIVYLPDEDIHGNDHFMFQDLNNAVIADHMAAWLVSHKL